MPPRQDLIRRVSLTLSVILSLITGTVAVQWCVLLLQGRSKACAHRAKVICANADEDRIYLPKVQAQDQEYLWNDRDLPTASVVPRSCKACAFYEDRSFPLKKLCEVDFADTGAATKSAEGQFDASFACEECKYAPSPDPTPMPTPSPQPDHRADSQSKPKLVIAMVFASMIGVGLLLGVSITTAVFILRNRRKAQADANFEAAMQDSGLGLDEAFEQDAEAFHQSLLNPSAWYKLKDGPSPDH